MRLSWLVPPLGWMVVIAMLSSPGFSAEYTAGVIVPVLRWTMPWATGPHLESMHLLVRKLAHLTEYAVLSILWWRALVHGSDAPRGRAAAWALAISVAWAALDEAHQALEPMRTASVRDIVLDTAGAVSGLVAAWRGWLATVDALTATLLWAAAIGGAALLALDAAAGVSSGLLWLAVPGALAGLLLRRRWRRIVREGVR
jgi:VanZ family protein